MGVCMFVCAHKYMYTHTYPCVYHTEAQANMAINTARLSWPQNGHYSPESIGKCARFADERGEAERLEVLEKIKARRNSLSGG
jgi:hypothetical protein